MVSTFSVAASTGTQSPSPHQTSGADRAAKPVTIFWRTSDQWEKSYLTVMPVKSLNLPNSLSTAS